jgi:hypothetical protein
MRIKFVNTLFFALHAQRLIRGFLTRVRTKVLRMESERNIFLLAKSEQEDAVIALITFDKQGEDAEFTCKDVDGNGDTVLAIAASKGMLRLIKKTLEWGTDPNTTNKRGKAAIDLAIERGRPVAAEYLLSKVEIHLRSGEGGKEGKKNVRSILHEAAGSGMSRFVKTLLEHDNVDVNAIESSTGRTPLHEAALAAMSEQDEVIMRSVTKRWQDYKQVDIDGSSSATGSKEGGGKEGGGKEGAAAMNRGVPGRLMRDGTMKQNALNKRRESGMDMTDDDGNDGSNASASSGKPLSLSLSLLSERYSLSLIYIHLY